jgi:hypothetical protein
MPIPARPEYAGAKAPPGRGGWRLIGYTFQFAAKDCVAMEAERLNQLAATLADLANRTADLRRYL